MDDKDRQREADWDQQRMAYLQAFRAGRAERTKAEQRAGAKQVKINMAQGLIDQFHTELDPRGKFAFILIPEGDDVRQWGVKVDFNNGQAHAENFFVFPSDELRAKLMLFS